MPLENQRWIPPAGNKQDVDNSHDGRQTVMEGWKEYEKSPPRGREREKQERERKRKRERKSERKRERCWKKYECRNKRNQGGRRESVHNDCSIPDGAHTISGGFIPTEQMPAVLCKDGMQECEVGNPRWLLRAGFENVEILSLLDSYQGEPRSIPGRVTPEFSHVRIVPDDTAGCRVFSGVPRFPHPPFRPVLLHASITLIDSQDLAQMFLRWTSLLSRGKRFWKCRVVGLRLFAPEWVERVERNGRNSLKAVIQEGGETSGARHFSANHMERIFLKQYSRNLEHIVTGLGSLLTLSLGADISKVVSKSCRESYTRRIAASLSDVKTIDGKNTLPDNENSAPRRQMMHTACHVGVDRTPGSRCQQAPTSRRTHGLKKNARKILKTSLYTTDGLRERTHNSIETRRLVVSLYSPPLEAPTHIRLARMDEVDYLSRGTTDRAPDAEGDQVHDTCPYLGSCAPTNHFPTPSGGESVIPALIMHAVLSIATATGNVWCIVLTADSLWGLMIVEPKCGGQNGEYHNPNFAVEWHTSPMSTLWSGDKSYTQSALIVLHATLTAQRYVDKIIHPRLFQFLAGNPSSNCIRRVQTPPWTAWSPDMSPIENVWDQLKLQLPRATKSGIWNTPSENCGPICLRKTFGVCWTLCQTVLHRVSQCEGAQCTIEDGQMASLHIVLTVAKRSSTVPYSRYQEADEHLNDHTLQSVTTLPQAITRADDSSYSGEGRREGHLARILSYHNQPTTGENEETTPGVSVPIEKAPRNPHASSVFVISSGGHCALPLRTCITVYHHAIATLDIREGHFELTTTCSSSLMLYAGALGNKNPIPSDVPNL
ncbi:hypothetical protein PR048_025538 [Dryococelus australis]|uniref:Uncharacterized protein n=1 Tax=Dryococelus australis TaxID=614101 RepID=A0ABQ9GRN8_9NEOP|nr:hypothetical protein PR048_025538 [Dryococelus australis]